MTRPQRLVLVLAVLSLSACAWVPKLKFWGDNYDFVTGSVDVRELRRALLCGTPTEEAVVRLFDTVEELRAWDDQDNLRLDRVELPADKSFVVLEQGLRRTGGYSVELRRKASVDEQGTLRLQADWLEPLPDRVVTQMMTSLCVLVAVDAQPYRQVEVQDSTEQLKASAIIERD